MTDLVTLMSGEDLLVGLRSWADSADESSSSDSGIWEKNCHPSKKTVFQIRIQEVLDPDSGGLLDPESGSRVLKNVKSPQSNLLFKFINH